MFQLVKSDELIVGEKYYIKPIKRKEFKKLFGIFQQYDKWYDEISNAIIFTILDEQYKDEYEINPELEKFYRVITREEYYTKLKEKYDQTCLNIVLKRLVNDTFEW